MNDWSPPLTGADIADQIDHIWGHMDSICPQCLGDRDIGGECECGE